MIFLYTWQIIQVHFVFCQASVLSKHSEKKEKMTESTSGYIRLECAGMRGSFPSCLSVVVMLNLPATNTNLLCMPQIFSSIFLVQFRPFNRLMMRYLMYLSMHVSIYVNMLFFFTLNFFSTLACWCIPVHSTKIFLKYMFSGELHFQHQS